MTFRQNSTLSPESKVDAPPMVYIAGEEMTHYAMNLIVDQWVKPYFDTSKWEHFDLSCKARDETNDQVLTDAVEAGKRIGAIFKEPTITPTAVQVNKRDAHIYRNCRFGLLWNLFLSIWNLSLLSSTNR